MSNQLFFKSLFRWLNCKGPEINTKADVMLGPASQPESYLHFFLNPVRRYFIHYHNFRGEDYENELRPMLSEHHSPVTQHACTQPQ